MKYGVYKFNRGKYSTADLEEGVAAVSVESSVANVTAQKILLSGALSQAASGVAFIGNLTVKGTSGITSNVTSSCNGQVTTTGGQPSMTSNSSSSCAGVIIHDGLVTNSFGIYGISTTAANCELILIGGAATTANVTTFNQCGFVLTANIVDVSTSSTVVSVARLKWTPILEGSEIWTIIAA